MMAPTSLVDGMRIGFGQRMAYFIAPQWAMTVLWIEALTKPEPRSERRLRRHPRICRRNARPIT